MRPIYYLLPFPAIALSGVAVSGTASPTPAPAEIVRVGEREIILPSPPGYFRFDGWDEELNRAFEESVPESNRLLAVFASEQDVARVRQNESPKFERHLRAESYRELEDMITSTEFEELESGFRTDSEFTVFDETQDSIVFSIKSGGVGGVVKVRDRVILLLCYSEDTGRSDTNWMKATVKQWRDKILAANPFTAT
jgi:hypothetical protein